jgi:rRNA-processing protein FCF1
MKNSGWMKANEKSNKKETDKNPDDVKKIIVDTNALIFAVQNKIDLTQEIEREMVGDKFKIMIPFPVVQELNRIIETKKTGIKDRMNARVALLMIENWKKNNKVEIIGKEEKPGIADKWIIKNIKNDRGFIVVTYDRELKRHLKEKGIAVLEIKIE